MKSLSWNVRGTGRKSILAYLRDIISLHNMPTLVLLETKIREDKASRVLSKINQFYSARELKFGNRFSGGIWVFWDTAQVPMSKMDDSDQHITFLAKPTHTQGGHFLFTAIYASPDCTLRKN